VGVPAEDFEAVFGAGILPGEVGDDGVELGGEGGEIGGGEGEEGVEGVGVGVEEGVVDVVVGLASGGVERGLGFVETGKGAVPIGSRAGFGRLVTLVVAKRCILPWLHEQCRTPGGHPGSGVGCRIVRHPIPWG